MVVTLTREAFDSLDDRSLVWTCVEPVIREIRGRNLAVKKQAAGELNDAQRALLMVQVVYGHAQGDIDGLFISLSYVLAGKGVWEEIVKSFRFFSGEEAAAFIETLRSAYESAKEPGPETKRELSGRLTGQLGRTLRQAAAYIRGNPGMFVAFSE